MCSVVWYDFEGDSEDKKTCINTLTDSFDIDLPRASAVFDRLCQISEDLNSTSGSIDRDGLIKRVIDLIPSIQLTANTGLLTLEQYLQRNEIKPLIDNTFLNREEELALIEKFVIDPITNPIRILEVYVDADTRLLREFLQDAFSLISDPVEFTLLAIELINDAPSDIQKSILEIIKEI